MRINGQQVYQCVYACAEATWIENAGVWVCDTPEHDANGPQRLSEELNFLIRTEEAKNG